LPITVNFQIRSSINAGLIGFALKGTPKWGLGDFFWGGEAIFGGNP